MPGTAPEAIPLDYDLLESGVVDSLGLLKIVSYIEETLQISIEPEAMLPENFRSLAAILDLLGTTVERRT
jgi:acyl carrier protein